MLCTVLLLALLLWATMTDVRAGYIYNITTYPGILFALAASTISTILGADMTSGSKAAELYGFTSIAHSALGLLACGGVMVVCFVLFGDDKVGGGDVKLLAMVGAFLGIYAGIEALLWTFLIGAVFALLHLIWQYGAWRLVVQATRFLLYVMRVGPSARLSQEERQPLATRLWLAPSALAAVLIVRFQLIELF